DLVRRGVLRALLIDAQGFRESLVVGQWLHVLGIEEDALLRTLGLDVAAGDGEDRPIRLGIAFLGNAGPVVGLAVAVQVLALGRLGNVEIVIPGLGGLLAELGQYV